MFQKTKMFLRPQSSKGKVAGPDSREATLRPDLLEEANQRPYLLEEAHQGPYSSKEATWPDLEATSGMSEAT